MLPACLELLPLLLWAEPRRPKKCRRCAGRGVEFWCHKVCQRYSLAKREEGRCHWAKMCQVLDVQRYHPATDWSNLPLCDLVRATQTFGGVPCHGWMWMHQASGAPARLQILIFMQCFIGSRSSVSASSFAWVSQLCCPVSSAWKCVVYIRFATTGSKQRPIPILSNWIAEWCRFSVRMAECIADFFRRVAVPRLNDRLTAVATGMHHGLGKGRWACVPPQSSPSPPRQGRVRDKCHFGAQAFWSARPKEVLLQEDRQLLANLPSGPLQGFQRSWRWCAWRFDGQKCLWWHNGESTVHVLGFTVDLDQGQMQLHTKQTVDQSMPFQAPSQLRLHSA